VKGRRYTGTPGSQKQEIKTELFSLSGLSFKHGRGPEHDRRRVAVPARTDREQGEGVRVLLSNTQKGFLHSRTRSRGRTEIEANA